MTTSSQYGARPALFLDRDGVLIKDTGYLCHARDMVFYDDIFTLLAWAQRRGFYLLLLTNQSGIARGYYSEDDFKRGMKHIEEILAGRGIKLDAWYYCPYHPDGQGAYRKNSTLRKPSPGMALQAMQDFSIRLEASFMIGDQESDQLELEGLRTLLINTRRLRLKPGNAQVDDHKEALLWLEQAAGAVESP